MRAVEKIVNIREIKKISEWTEKGDKLKNTS